MDEGGLIFLENQPEILSEKHAYLHLWPVLKPDKEDEKSLRKNSRKSSMIRIDIAINDTIIIQN